MALIVNSDGYVVSVGDPTEPSALDALLQNLPNASLLTEQMKQDALNASLVPDSAGVWPGQDGYVPTFDVYYAAIKLIGFLQAQPVVRQTSSEGTSVAVDAPNWSGLLSYYRGMSTINQSIASGPLLRAIPIPETPHVVHTDMRSGGGYYGNVDTDLD
jgi:hypothetical protein